MVKIRKSTGIRICTTSCFCQLNTTNDTKINKRNVSWFAYLKDPMCTKIFGTFIWNATWCLWGFCFNLLTPYFLCLCFCLRLHDIHLIVPSIVSRHKSGYNQHLYFGNWSNPGWFAHPSGFRCLIHSHILYDGWIQPVLDCNQNSFPAKQS